MKVEFQQGNITRFRGDAIVNAANARMLGGGGVDGAIHRAAGPELRAACEQVPEVEPGIRCPTGEARITPGFNLPAKFVIHTVGPIFYNSPTPGEIVEAHRDQQEPKVLLKSAIRSCLALAEQNGIKTMAMPAISCGVFGGQVPLFAKFLHEVVNEKSWDIEVLRVVLFQDFEFEQFRQTWAILTED